MVLLAVRTGSAADAPRFLCSALTSHPVQEVVEMVVAVHNMRLRLQASVDQCTTVGAKRARPDDAALAAASELLSAQSVRRKLVLTPQQLVDAATALEAGAAEHAVPEELSVDAAELFFAGRTLQRDALLSDYVGRNDKSQVQVQLVGGAGSSNAGSSSSSSSSASASDAAAAAPAAATGPPSEPVAGDQADSADAIGAAAAASPPNESGVSLSSYFKGLRGEPTPEGGGTPAAAADEEEDPARLGEEQAARLLRAQPVHAMLRDPRLQQLLRCTRRRHRSQPACHRPRETHPS